MSIKCRLEIPDIQHECSHPVNKNHINFCNDDFSFLFNFTGFCTFAITFEHNHTCTLPWLLISSTLISMRCWIHKNNSKVSTSQLLLLYYHCRVTAMRGEKKINVKLNKCFAPIQWAFMQIRSSLSFHRHTKPPPRSS